MQALLQLLPNCLTALRLLLALPMGFFILREQFGAALVVVFLAGLTDAVDGYLARRLQAFTPLGAALDPIADKLLITVAFLSTASLGLIPWWLAGVVITRDLVILGGACCYRLLFGRLDYQPTVLSKASLFVQIVFCLLVLARQVVPAIPAGLISPMQWLVVLLAVTSGLHYVLQWSARARREYRETRP